MKQVEKVSGDDNGPEPVDDFMGRCHLQALQCDYKTDEVEGGNTERDERLIEQLIAGTLYSDVQKELLAKDKKLKLEHALAVARDHEGSLIHMAQLAKAQGPAPVQSKTTTSAVAAISKVTKCGKYGRRHPGKQLGKCPAYDTECDCCHKQNHWKSVQEPHR